MLSEQHGGKTIMTQHELLCAVEKCVDAINFLVESHELLDIAIEISDDCETKTSKRLLLLIDIYKSRTDCAFDDIKHPLADLQRYLDCHADISA